MAPDLVGTALQDPVKVLQGSDAAAHCQWNEDLGCHAAEDVREEVPALSRGGDVIEHQLVSPGIVVEPSHLHRVCQVPESPKVDALHHPAVPDVETWDNALG